MPKQLLESERRVLELHVVRARDLALKLFASSSAIYPGSWERPFIEPIVVDLFDFAFHGRRVEELTAITLKEKPEMMQGRYQILANGPPNVCKCFTVALDLLVHAKTYVLGNAVLPEQTVFLNSKNLVVSFVTVETDKGKNGSIFVYGLVLTYLNHMLPALRDTYPQLQF